MALFKINVARDFFKKQETLRLPVNLKHILIWGYIWITEYKMEAIITGYVEFRVWGLGIFREIQCEAHNRRIL